ncbi:hypothetical protein PFICI_03042 [Pestalotiopsis fici W106-1]|uniref:Uncharacterized protein n=1 Tax=Pestalotiopsis fici (strain W106-1 / CGMCC3.15140) TaxID=1229662 RepID=W3XHU8_PESFW|nr:uncharacterized protein PFICI_03042 [Pestalotiopsis fici W106-1]ETS85017.1 hypothetical protein PFICI_03042 [Pestalotiopsis fici W106-1]
MSHASRNPGSKPGSAASASRTSHSSSISRRSSGMSRHSTSAHSRASTCSHSHSHPSASVHSRPRDSVRSSPPSSVHSRPPGSVHSHPPSSVHSHNRNGVRGSALHHQYEDQDGYDEAYGEPNLEAQLRFSAELTAGEPPVEVYDSVSQVGHRLRNNRHHAQLPPLSMPPPPLPRSQVQHSPASSRFHGSRAGGGERRRSVGRAVNELSTGSSPQRMSNTQRRPSRSSGGGGGGGGGGGSGGTRGEKRKEKGAKKTGIKVAGGGEVVKLSNGKLALVRKPKQSSKQ